MLDPDVLTQLLVPDVPSINRCDAHSPAAQTSLVSINRENERSLAYPSLSPTAQAGFVSINRENERSLAYPSLSPTVQADLELL